MALLSLPLLPDKTAWSPWAHKVDLYHARTSVAEKVRLWSSLRHAEAQHHGLRTSLFVWSENSSKSFQQKI